MTDLDAILNDTPRLEQAFCQAIEEALHMHKRAGNPIAVWRDGQVGWLSPEEIPVALDPTS